MWLPWLLAAGSAHGHDLIDLRTFQPPPPEARKIVSPTIRWWFRDNPESLCRTTEDKDGFAIAKGGCVFWQSSKSSCTLVTSQLTTHSVLGHLLLLCLKTGAES